MTIYDFLKQINEYNKDNTQCPALHETAQDKDFKNLLIADRIASCPICAYGIYHKALKECFCKDKKGEKAKWERLWLKHCISQETNYIFEVLREVKGEKEEEYIRVEREESVKEIAFQSLLKKGGSLQKAIASEDGRGYYKKVLINWFLKRYNWKDAFQLHLEKENLFLPILIGVSVTLLPFLILFLLTIGNINLKPSFVHHPLLMTQHQMEAKPPQHVMPELKDILADAVSGVPIYAEIFSIILLMFILLFFSSRKYTHFIFPRILGANFIGLLPLVTQEVSWTFPLRLNWGQIYLLSAISLLVAFVYLTIECRKVTAIRLRKAIARALPITFYGLLLSISMSVVCCDILAIHCLNYNKIIYDTSYKGLLGLLYPKIIVFFAFSSFLIGIFVQLLWEEKTVTEPL